MRVLSLGAGVQSSTLALMLARSDQRLGGLTVDAAIFADTQCEPGHVYSWLDWLETQLPFPVYRVTKGNLADYATRVVTSRKGHKYVENGLPMKTMYADGGGGIRQRFCTNHFKIVPIHRKIVELVGGAAAVRAWRKGDHAEPLVEKLIGISADEWARAKPSSDAWIAHRHPLLDIGMTRAGCLKWMEDNGFPTPAKSSCTFCPFHGDTQWKQMKDNDPAAWDAAVTFERRMNSAIAEAREYNDSLGNNTARITNMYLHRDLIPLDQVTLRPKQAAEQFGLWDDWTEECEGMCGV